MVLINNGCKDGSKELFFPTAHQMKSYVFQTIQGSDSLVRGEKFNSIEIRPNNSTHDFYVMNPSLFFDLPY